jgi:hypothetical protein
VRLRPGIFPRAASEPGARTAAGGTARFRRARSHGSRTTSSAASSRSQAKPTGRCCVRRAFPRSWFSGTARKPGRRRSRPRRTSSTSSPWTLDGPGTRDLSRAALLRAGEPQRLPAVPVMNRGSPLHASAPRDLPAAPGPAGRAVPRSNSSRLRRSPRRDARGTGTDAAPGGARNQDGPGAGTRAGVGRTRRREARGTRTDAAPRGARNQDGPGAGTRAGVGRTRRPEAREGSGGRRGWARRAGLAREADGATSGAAGWCGAGTRRGFAPASEHFPRVARMIRMR